ncbi:MAG TPA: ParB/RepB/Spo0J family partition protein [Spirochaetia bacterium]|nr:ParB/RepB/Spo0J family partition protein [Spirochaetia bacterium]
MSKKALGRGIDALLSGGDGDAGLETHAGVEHVPISQLRPNPNQPRKDFNPDSLAELAQSIKQKGIIQPVLVEDTGDGFLIIAGERRYRAAQMAGLTEIPVLVREFSDDDKLEIALIENLQREDLNPIEEAIAYKRLLDEKGLNQDEVADRVGKNRSTVANSLRLLKLPQDMQNSLAKGEISAGHARAILSVLNPSDQRILFSRIMQDGLSVREAEFQAGELNKGRRPVPLKEKSEAMHPQQDQPELADIEQKLIDALGTKVSIKGSMRHGKIEIAYYSMDDLERILEIIVPPDKLF